MIQEEPKLSARAIAAELGVGKDTILRDLRAIGQSAPDDAPDGDTLVLVLDEPLRQALAVLRATLGGADTPEQNERAARAAIRATAQTFREAQQNNTEEGARP